MRNADTGIGVGPIALFDKQFIREKNALNVARNLVYVQMILDCGLSVDLLPLRW